MPLPSAVNVTFQNPTIASSEAWEDTSKSEAEPNSAPLQDCGETTAPLCPGRYDKHSALAFAVRIVPIRTRQSCCESLECCFHAISFTCVRAGSRRGRFSRITAREPQQGAAERGKSFFKTAGVKQNRPAYTLNAASDRAFRARYMKESPGTRTGACFVFGLNVGA